MLHLGKAEATWRESMTLAEMLENSEPKLRLLHNFNQHLWPCLSSPTSVSLSCDKMTMCIRYIMAVMLEK